jgi:L-rhamnose-H+ transport protein
MTENWTTGMILVVVAGLLQGSFMLPTKYVKKWSWENMWLSYSVLAYLIFPWGIAFVTIPELRQVLSETSTSTIVRTLLFGFGWGLGCLTFGLGIDFVGLALGFAIILGLTASIGTLVPLFVLSSRDLALSQTILIVVGVAVMLVGISVCAWAGNMKERALGSDKERQNASLKKSYKLGLLFCLLSGVLSPLGNLGFAFAPEMTTVAMRLNTPEQYVSIPFWAVIIFPLFICNAAFCLYLLLKKHTMSKFLLPRTGYYHLLTASMGVMWLVGMLIYGAGANKLGKIGPSIGWAILMSLVVIVANLWGLATGEWRGTGRRPVRTMNGGLLLLLIAIFVIGLSNQ